MFVLMENDPKEKDNIIEKKKKKFRMTNLVIVI